MAIGVTTSISFHASSQATVGAHASYLVLFGGTDAKTIGFGLNGGYTIQGREGRIMIYGGANFYAGSVASDHVIGTAFSDTTMPPEIQIDADYDISFTHLYIGVKRYFVGGVEDASFGVYGIGEAGLLLTPFTTTLGDYDGLLYYPEVADGTKETLSNFVVSTGPGVEVKLKVVYLYFDLKFSVPVNWASSEEPGVHILFSFAPCAGLRYSF